MNNEEVAWLNGEFLSFDDARIPVSDLGIVAGASISEMARTYRHQPFRLPLHIDRLLKSCAEIGFEVPQSRDELLHASQHLLNRNVRGLPENEDIGLVAFVTAGANPTYAVESTRSHCTVCLHTFRLPFGLWRTAAEQGVRLSIPRRRQIPDTCLPVHLKVRNRLHWWLADREAANMEGASRALLLNQDGQVTETSTSCFYIVVDGSVQTAATGVLNSMTRQFVRELCDSIRIPFQLCQFSPEAVFGASEALVTSTAFGLLPVLSVNQVPIGKSFPGQVYEKLATQWEAVTGVNPRQQVLDSLQSQ